MQLSIAAAFHWSEHCSENKPLQPARTYFPSEILVGALNEYSINTPKRMTEKDALSELCTRP